MTTLSLTDVERARKYEALFLKRLSDNGQRPAAEAIGVSESTVSKLKETYIKTLCSLLPALGLKLVPAEMQCYRPDDINPLLHLARMHLDSITSAEQLRWED